MGQFLADRIRWISEGLKPGLTRGNLAYRTREKAYRELSGIADELTRPDIITMAKGGTVERDVPLKEIEIPDLWHIAGRLKDGGTHIPRDADDVLECWHLCHDLLKHIKGE